MPSLYEKIGIFLEKYGSREGSKGRIAQNIIFMVLKVSNQVTENFFGAMHVKHLFINQKHTISQLGKSHNNFKSNDIESN